jgi:hypothetical protein
MVDIQAVALRISLPKLLTTWRIVLPELSLIEPHILLEISPQGEPNWELKKDETEDEGVWLPTIESLLIKGGRLAYRDPTENTQIDATFAATEGEGDAVTQVQASGRLQGEPLQFRLTGGSLLTLPQAGKPYPLKAQLDASGITARIEGTLRQPLQLEGVDLAVAIEGDDLTIASPFTDQALPDVPPYQLRAKLLRQEAAWTLQDLQSRLGDSDLQGTISIDTSGERPLIKAELVSHTLDIQPLVDRQSDTAAAGQEAGEEGPDQSARTRDGTEDSQDARPDRDPASAQNTAQGTAPPATSAADQINTLDFTPLQAVDAEVSLQVERLITPQLPLNDVAVNLTLREGRLQVNPLEVAFGGGGSVGVQLALNAAREPVQGSAQIQLRQLDLDRVTAGSQDSNALGTLDGQIQLSLAKAPRDRAQTVNSLLTRLRFDDSSLRYRDPQANTDITATIGTIASGKQAGGIQIKGQGQYQGQPLALTLEADPIAHFGAQDKPYSLAGHLETKGEGAMPPFQFSTGIAQQGNDWELSGFQARLGETDVSGAITVTTGGERPLITADLVSQKLDLRPFTTKPDHPSGAPGQPAAAEPLNLAPLRRVDAKIAYRVKEVVAPGLPLENFSLELELNDGRLRVEPLRTQLKGDHTLVSRLRLDATDEPFNGTLTTEFQRLDLDTVAKAFSEGSPQQSLGVLSGTLNLTFTGAEEGQQKDAALPYLGRLAIKPSPLSYTNAALKLEDVDATVSTEDLATGKIRLDGKGRYRGQAFSLKFTGDPLLDLRKQQPYSLDLAAEALQTEARIKGRLMEPLAFKGLDVSLSLKGPDPYVLYPLIDIALPSLPPYSIKGQLARQGSIWKLLDFDGRVGDSDLHGDIEVDTKGERPFLAADLTSNLLDLDDLGGLIGAQPDPEETASKEQQQKAAVQEQKPTVLPDAPINLEKVNSINASVKFQGKRVQTTLPMDDVALKFELKNSRMTFKPLNFGVGGGDIRFSTLDLDANGKPVKGEIEVEFSRIDLKHLLKSFEVADESAGIIGGRAKLWVRGNSLAEFMASADGGLYLLMTGGKFDHLLVELGGLDIAESLGALFGKTRDVPIECAYADLHARDGQMKLATFVIDTTDTLFALDGAIDFDRERLDVTIKPYPKDISPLSVRGPVHIDGRFKNPEIRPDEVTVGRITLAAILGAVATPVAALIPLIETGPGEDTTYCQGFVKDLKRAQSQ